MQYNLIEYKTKQINWEVAEFLLLFQGKYILLNIFSPQNANVNYHPMYISMHLPVNNYSSHADLFNFTYSLLVQSGLLDGQSQGILVFQRAIYVFRS